MCGQKKLSTYHQSNNNLIDDKWPALNVLALVTYYNIVLYKVS